MASLRKRSKSDFSVCCYTTANGRRTQRSTGTVEKDQAIMVCRQWEGEARVAKETLEAAAMDSGRGKGRRLIWAAAAIVVLLQIGALLGSASPPVMPTPGLPNDNMESVWPLPAAPQAVFPARVFAVLDSTNRGATPGVFDSLLNGGRTVWFRWNAPAQLRGKNQVTISTKGSDFDTIMKVVDPTTNNPDGDPKDNAKTGAWSEETYPWTPGQKFLICVDGVGGAQGNIRISAKLE